MNNLYGLIPAAILLALGTVIFSGCGQGPEDKAQCGDAPAPSQVSLFDSSVPAEQQKLLSEDLRRLEKMDRTRIADVNDGTSLGKNGSLKNWLDARIKKLVGPGAENRTCGIRTLKNNHAYDPQVTQMNMGASAQTLTAMTNISAAIYIAGKKNRVVYGFTVDEGVIRVTTPRTGIVQIGKDFSSIQLAGDPSSFANSALRLATLFHEARHGDGNGEHAGFPHTECPKKHPLAGHSACDDTANGPYSIGATVLEYLAEQCTDCDRGNKLTLKALANDFRGRAETSDGRASARADDRPEAIE